VRVTVAPNSGLLVLGVKVPAGTLWTTVTDSGKVAVWFPLVAVTTKAYVPGSWGSR